MRAKRRCNRALLRQQALTLLYSLSNPTASHTPAPFPRQGRYEVDYDRFRTGLERIGAKLSKEQSTALAKAYDPIDDGGVFYRELALALSGGEAVHKHASIEVYPNFAEFDITPIDSVVTGRPYEQTELPQRVAPKIGLSEIETHCAFALVGLRLVAKDVLTKLDGNKDGCLTLRELQKALQQLGIDPTDDVTEMLIAKYDTHHNGQLDLNEFMHKLSPYMGLSDANLARMNLARKNPMGPMPKERQLAGAAAAPAKGAAAPSPAKAESHGSHGPHGSHGASASSASANFASPARAGAGAGAGDADTIATANLDLSSTHAKMRKVLGRSMAAVLAEVKRKGSSGGGSGAVSGDAFRDVLASAGVPLTSKEVRALSLKYGAGNGSLQVDEIWRETFTSPAKVAADRKAAATKH